MSAPVQFKENVPCDNCGRFGAYDFRDMRLCADCYEERGSCCAESCTDDAPEVDASEK